MSGGVCIIGGGAWGTALGAMRARGGEPVALYARDAETVRAIAERHENPRYLPGIALPKSLNATSDLGAALAGAEIALLVLPAQALRAASREMAPHLPPGTALVLCSKGIERDTGLFASAVVEAELPGHPVAVLSGPSFAADVAAGLPTAVT
ncbi:2-dehydropantoate 2-reductase N-terminal domain-containing protein, partial [Aureimonas sp. AU40]|uniref:2-dehydropantoate 2-reductase N-terminal domain-containing protein n=1 Tax=Aureimonas sp. AU40 TaxID=1637747 RepID=UPI000AB8C711